MAPLKQALRSSRTQGHRGWLRRAFPGNLVIDNSVGPQRRDKEEPAAR